MREKKKLYPVVDKRLGIVFGVPFGGHEMLLSKLYLYHKAQDGKKLERPGDSESSEDADRFVAEGMGYFMSSLGKDSIMVSRKMGRDSIDKSVLESGLYNVDKL